MILSRYIFNSTLKIFLGILLAFMLAVSGNSLVSFLSQAAKGEVPAQLISSLVLLSLPLLTTYLVLFTFSIAVVSAIGGLSSNNELVVMKTSGYTPARLQLVIQMLAWLVAAAALANSVWLAPASEGKKLALIEQVKSDPGSFMLAPGKFMTFTSGREPVTIYVSGMDTKQELEEEKSLKNLDGYSNLHDVKIIEGFVSGVTVAEHGYISRDENGMINVTLLNGTRYSGPDEKNRYSSTTFKRFRTVLNEHKDEEHKSKIYAVPTWQLFEPDEQSGSLYVSELEWRLVLPLSIPLMAFIIVPISSFNPRSGRTGRYLITVSICFVYFFCLLGVRAGIEHGVIPAAPGLLIVPAVFFAALGSAFNVPFKRYIRAMLRGRRDARAERREASGAGKEKDTPAGGKGGSDE
nr:LptF/LptG family permease [Succinivibrionaceae bacterium]